MITKLTLSIARGMAHVAVFLPLALSVAGTIMAEGSVGAHLLRLACALWYVLLVVGLKVIPIAKVITYRKAVTYRSVTIGGTEYWIIPKDGVE